MNLKETCIRSGHKMKKTILAGFLILLILLGILIYKNFLHFELYPGYYKAVNVTMDGQSMEFDLELGEPFTRLCDYKYEVKDEVLYVTLFGTHTGINEIHHVSIPLKDPVKMMIFRNSKGDEVTSWEL